MAASPESDAVSLFRQEVKKKAMHAKSDKQGIETTDFLLNILTIIKLIRCKNRNIFPYSCTNNLFSDFLSEKRGTMNKQSALLETGVDNQTEKE